MKYITRHREIEAEQWFSGSSIEGVCHCQQSDYTNHFHMLDMIMSVNEGDYIADNGNFRFPILQSDFERNWKPASTDNSVLDMLNNRFSI